MLPEFILCAQQSALAVLGALMVGIAIGALAAIEFTRRD